jgi:hypothetical protein
MPVGVSVKTSLTLRRMTRTLCVCGIIVVAVVMSACKKKKKKKGFFLSLFFLEFTSAENRSTDVCGFVVVVYYDAATILLRFFSTATPLGLQTSKCVSNSNVTRGDHQLEGGLFFFAQFFSVLKKQLLLFDLFEVPTGWLVWLVFFLFFQQKWTQQHVKEKKKLAKMVWGDSFLLCIRTR